MHGLFLYCRAGFEAECAAEIQERAGSLGIYGYCKAKPESGYVVFMPGAEGDADRLHRELSFDELIFTRQWFVILTMRNDLPQDDRITALFDGLAQMHGAAESLVIETPDTNEAKQLSGLCKSIYKPAEALLIKAGLLQRERSETGRRIHICFMSLQAAYAGYSLCCNSTSWPMGIPRLKSPSRAPSRSTLKLDEAFLTFLKDSERESLLHKGMTAVDLGACPGGWTWQLVRRGMHVIAIDNGAMADVVMETGLVTHIRTDGYRFQPDQPVDWMVCDIVESPIHTAELAARWLAQGWCQRSIFNLKLPMKKRWQELKRCLDLIDSHLAEAGVKYKIRARQLYHDREEVTVYLCTQVSEFILRGGSPGNAGRFL
jgi:23S rRNA (cytidine2498-2'-O)-methyltransferase